MEDPPGPETSPPTIDPRATLGPLQLRVRNPEDALGFYQDALGFRPLTPPSTADDTVLGTAGGEPLLRLVASTRGRAPSDGAIPRRARLYHFGLLLPERKDLATLLRFVLDHRETVHLEGAADHYVSESVYVQDPEGNGIELTWDRPRKVWEGVTLGEMLRKNAPLDTESLLAEADPGGWTNLPPGATVGHVHLYGSDLGGSRHFYATALGLGFRGMAHGMAAFHVADYHHHVGVNSWLGRGIPPASDEGPGLDHFALRFPDSEALERTVRSLEEAGVAVEGDDPERSSVSVRDPNNFRIRLYVG